MRLETYIGDLLYRYQCVVVPEFGAFLAEQKSARLDSNSNAFYPPTKQISFNEQLHSNDGLLVKYIADVEGIPYEKVLTQLINVVESWKKLLNRKEKLNLKNIGYFSLNDTSKLQFHPIQTHNYLTTSFGLSSVVSSKVSREVLKEEVQEIEEVTPILFTPEERKRTPYLKYAAIALLAISIGAIGIQLYKGQIKQQLQLVDQKAQEKVEETVQQATFFDTQPKVLPSVKLAVEQNIKRHKIIAGAFRIEANANKKVAQLRAKGYDARLIGKNKYGLHQVIYASYSNPKDALFHLRQIKRSESSEAWLLSE